MTEHDIHQNPYEPPSGPDKILVEGLKFWYGDFNALTDINVGIKEKAVTAFIGPSGCGKSTFIRCFNRMNDLIPGTRLEGRLTLDDQDIYGSDVDPVDLRRRVGMIFQQPNPFSMSIYENVAYGLRVQGIKKKSILDQAVEESLQKSALWSEVKDRLNTSALGLSGGQQQRLCIARTIAVKPQIVLMDEPCSALDPIATARIEELIAELQQDFTIVIVTHNMQQATRVSDRTAFFYLGELVEYDDTQAIFGNPSKKQTEDYVSGRFG